MRPQVALGTLAVVILAAWPRPEARRFEANPGSALGTVVLKQGQPTKFVLGEALLPNEIGAKEVTTLK